ncbi:tetratricopeptide repeat protein, partial [Corynebacterium meridianum]
LVVVVVGFYGDGVCVVGCFEGSVEDVRVAVRAAEEALKRRDFVPSGKEDRPYYFRSGNSPDAAMDINPIIYGVEEAWTKNEAARADRILNSAYKSAVENQDRFAQAVFLVERGRLARRIGNRSEAIAFQGRALEKLNQVSAETMAMVRAECQLELGIIFWRINGIEARDHFREAYELFNECESDLKCAEVVKAWSRVERDFGNLSYSRDLLDLAILIYQSLGNEAGVARCLHSRGILERRSGNLAKAVDDTQLAIETFGKVNNGNTQTSVANCLHSLGLIYFELEKYKDSRTLQLIAKRMYRRSASLESEAYCDMQLALISRELGQIEGVKPQIEKCLNIWRCKKNRLEEARCLLWLALISSQEENEVEFKKYIDAASFIYEDMNIAFGKVNALELRARHCAAHGQWDRAESFFKKARKIYSSSEDLNLLPCAWIDVERAQLIFEKTVGGSSNNCRTARDFTCGEGELSQLQSALDLALPAMILFNRVKSTFATASARSHWAQVTSKSIVLVFRLAVLMKNERLICDLVETVVNAGVHHTEILGRGSSIFPSRQETNFLPWFASEDHLLGLVFPQRGPAFENDSVGGLILRRDSFVGSRFHEEIPDGIGCVGSALTLGGSVGLIAGARLRMSEAPKLRMPDGHIALGDWLVNDERLTIQVK